MSYRYGKRMVAILALLVVLCLTMGITGCALPVGSMGEARLLAQARQDYRNASLVVSGTCLQSHVNAQGVNCYDLTVEKVLAGKATTGDVIHCTSPMTEGKSYLLYLQKGEDVPHTEDMQGYTLASGQPLALSQGSVVLDGQAISLETLLADMAKLDAMISAPSSIYYYDSLAQLVEAADDIFIGRVEEQEGPQDTQFHAQSNGTTVEHTIPATILHITAYGGIKGAMTYGDQVELVYAPGMNEDMINATTLAAEPYTAEHAPDVETGGIYLFFTMESPDAKQDYIFPVNPMQGFTQITNDALTVPYGNRAMLQFHSLDVAVRAIRTILDKGIA